MKIAQVEESMLRFYSVMIGRQVESISEIPSPALELLTSLDYCELIKPFIIKDLESGKSTQQISIKYGVTQHKIRGIGRNSGFYTIYCKKIHSKVV